MSLEIPSMKNLKEKTNDKKRWFVKNSPPTICVFFPTILKLEGCEAEFGAHEKNHMTER